MTITTKSLILLRHNFYFIMIDTIIYKTIILKFYFRIIKINKDKYIFISLEGVVKNQLSIPIFKLVIMLTLFQINVFLKKKNSTSKFILIKLLTDFILFIQYPD